MWVRTTLATIVSILLCFSSVAGAEKPARLLALTGDAGFGSIGGEGHATLHVGLDIREGNLAVGLLGRLRLVTKDAGGGIVRTRDYDEVSDYLHMLRYLSYRRDISGVTLRADAGELSGFTLGHGTIIRDYSNIADPDHQHGGVRLRVEHARIRLDAAIDNFINPRVISAYVNGAPFASLQGLRIGATMVLDPQAPLRLQRETSGRFAVDSTFRLQADQTVSGFAGIDLGYKIDLAKGSHILPYVDVNTSFTGLGVHAGATAQFRYQRFTFQAQAEYRAATPGYAPDYFGTFYDVDRYEASLTSTSNLPKTKLRALRDDDYSGQGTLFQLGVAMDKLGSLKAGYRYQPGPDGHRLWVRLATSPIKPMTVGVMVLARGLGGESAGSGVASLVEARYRFNKYFYALGQFTRVWSVGIASHRYEPLTGFNLGIGGSFSD